MRRRAHEVVGETEAARALTLMVGEHPTAMRLLLPALCLGFGVPAAAQIQFADIASSAGVLRRRGGDLWAVLVGH